MDTNLPSGSVLVGDHRIPLRCPPLCVPTDPAASLLLALPLSLAAVFELDLSVIPHPHQFQMIRLLRRVLSDLKCLDHEAI